MLRRIGRYVGNEESSPLVVDLQARVAVIFDGGTKGMVAEGRSRELRDIWFTLLVRRRVTRSCVNRSGCKPVRTADHVKRE